MKKTVELFTRYDVGDGFYIELMPEEKTSDFYIYHKDYGVKMFICGLLKSNNPNPLDFEHLIKCELERGITEEYKKRFIDEEN